MSSSSISNTAQLECPVCLQIPRKEIYQCINGHSICNVCMNKLEICPSCRVKISGSTNATVRNYYAETLLDTMKFACNLKDQGCPNLMARDQLTDHEIICKYGTMNICANEGSEECNFEFNTFLFNQAEKLNEVLEHFKSEHDYTVLKMEWDCVWNLQIDNSTFDEILQSNEPQTSLEARFFEVSYPKGSNQQNTRNDVFLLLVNFEQDSQKQLLFTFAFAMLTSETAADELSFKVEVCIKGQPKKEISNEWGDNYVPDIKGTMIPMNAQRLKRYYKMPVNEQPSFPFSIPISHIQKHYVDCNGKFNIQFSFHSE